MKSKTTEPQLVGNAIGHLCSLVDILGPCMQIDHHGHCQTHFIESPCRVGKAREFLESAELLNSKNEIIEALKECEYALKKVIETGKVGWLQESAYKVACAALTAKKSNAPADLQAVACKVRRDGG